MERYMMATKAFHMLGEISREVSDLCVIYGEDEESFIGKWATGFGLVNVKFPKSTTRELTDEEKEYWHGRQIAIGSRVIRTICTKEAEQHAGGVKA